MTDTKGPVQPRRSKRGRRRRRIVLILLGGLALYMLLGFFGVPLLIRKVGIPRLNERLAGTASLTKASFNPFILALSLEGVEVMDETGQRVIAFDRFVGNLQIADTLFRSGTHFRQALLTRPFVHGELKSDGQLNLARLIKPPATPAPPSKISAPLEAIPRIVVGELRITDGQLSLRDQTHTQPFEATVDGLHFSFDHVDTRPDHENIHRFTATTGRGGQVSWEGSFYADPLSSRGTLSLRNIDLPQLLPYTLDHTDAQIVNGRLSIDLNYAFAPVKQPRRARIDCSAITINDLEVTRDGQPLLNAPQLQLTEVTIDGDAQRLTANTIRSSGGKLFIARDASGRLAIQDLLTERPPTEPRDVTPASSAAEDAASSAAAHPISGPEVEYPIVMLQQAIQQLQIDLGQTWSVAVERIEFDQWTTAFTDQSPTRPVAITVTGAQFAAGPIESEKGYRVPFELAATVNQTGTIEARGELIATDATVEAQIKTDALALSAIAPYLPAKLLDPIPPAALTLASLFLDGRGTVAMPPSGLQASWSGTTRIDGLAVDNAQTAITMLAAQRIEVSGDVGAEVPQEGSFDATFQGDLEITALTANLPEIKQTNLSIQTVVVRGIVFSESEKKITVNELTLESPQLLANLALLPADAVAAQAPPAEAAPDASREAATPEPSRQTATPASAAPAYLFTLQKLRVNGSTIELTDQAAHPPLAVRVEDLDVEVSNLSTDGQSAADLTVSARLQSTGQLALGGKIDLFGNAVSAEVTLELTAVPLKPYDAFTGRYVGYLTDSGRLSATIPLTVDAGQLDGAIAFDFDKLHLGESVNSPDAPDAPIALGLDLLRDGNDHIASQLTLSGDLNDPNFSLGRIIWQAFINLLLKAATSPFDILASAFAAGQELDLSQVVFAAGAADCSAEALSAIDVLARALRERPELSLRVLGHYHQTLDERALQAEALKTELGGRSPDKKEVQRRYEEQFPDQPDVAFERMEAAVLSAFKIPQSRLAELARQRAETVSAILIQDGGLAAERVSVVAPEPDQLDADEPKVEFQLY